ncbi:MAG: hypothetical protein ACLS95_04175 [Clostridia bacterium]
MKIKIRKVLSFIGFILLILIIYMIFVFSIQKWIPTYENKVYTFDNEQQQDKEEITNTHVEIYWHIFDENGLVEDLSTQEENQWLQNPVLQGIQKYAEKAEEGEQIGNDEKVNRKKQTVKETTYGKLVSLYYQEENRNRYQYKIIFSEDMKNISLYMYQFSLNNRAYEADMFIKEQDREAEKKEEMIEMVTRCY